MKWSFKLYLFIKVLTSLLRYIKCFWGKSSSVKFAYQQLTFEKGHFQNIKAPNFVKSINCTMCFYSSQTKVTGNDKISTFMISERSFDFGNLLTLGIYIFRLLLFYFFVDPLVGQLVCMLRYAYK